MSISLDREYVTGKGRIYASRRYTKELTRSTSGWFSFAIKRDALSWKGAILCSAIRQAVGDWRGASRQVDVCAAIGMVHNLRRWPARVCTKTGGSGGLEERGVKTGDETRSEYGEGS